ncbi:MAG: VanW family protein, partial [Candidatus Daviesbacteria bacterium]|nr:VanW family protein [Candidatus Daviesbacteria bacterium]
NDVFKKNILLNLAYLEGRVTKASDIKWEKIEKPFKYEFKLEPNKTFAFHSDVKDIYKDSLIKTTNAHFNAEQGFKTDGYLFGDGVCHLASLINWAAKDAGLSVEAPTNHNFANIPDVPREHGVSIYSNPTSKGSSTVQNLYITNNKSKTISFKFEYQDNKVKVSVIELN